MVCNIVRADETLRFEGPLHRDAIAGLLDPKDRVIRVIGDPVKQAGLLIEATMDSGPMRSKARSNVAWPRRKSARRQSCARMTGMTM